MSQCTLFAVSTYRAFGARLAQEALGGQSLVGGDEIVLCIARTRVSAALACGR